MKHDAKFGYNPYSRSIALEIPEETAKNIFPNGISANVVSNGQVVFLPANNGIQGSSRNNLRRIYRIKSDVKNLSKLPSRGIRLTAATIESKQVGIAVNYNPEATMPTIRKGKNKKVNSKPETEPFFPRIVAEPPPKPVTLRDAIMRINECKEIHKDCMVLTVTPEGFLKVLIEY